MRYKPEHKEKTRALILQQAGLLFRRKGYMGVGIDEIMNAAKLTRGGFYGYFKTKAALFADVLTEEAGLDRMLRRRTGTTKQELLTEATEMLTGYLAPENASTIETQCTLASLPADVARSGSRIAKSAYTNKIKNLATEFDRTRKKTGETAPEATAQPSKEALAALVLTVGAFSIARAIDDPDFAKALLDAARDKALEQLR